MAKDVFRRFQSDDLYSEDQPEGEHLVRQENGFNSNVLAITSLFGESIVIVGFVCPLVAYTKGFAPLIYKLARDAGISPRMEWETTSATSPQPFAVGVAEMTIAQFENLNARTDMWVIDATLRKTTLVSQVPTAVRTKLQNTMTANNITANILGADTVQTAFDKLIQAISPSTLGDVITRFNANQGGAETP